MANTYRLGSDSYRLNDEPPQDQTGAITVVTDGGNANDNYDESSQSLQIPTADGGLVISFGPRPNARKTSHDFDDNLAEELSEPELAAIAERLMLGIEQDLSSRDAWLQNMSDGISLLGLEVKNPRGAATAASAPAEGVSTVDHPLLLEAVLRFQANAYGELLPADGPVKVRNDGEGDTLAARLADALEKDLNHYLTKVAKEYYPDTDRMLLQLGFCGISFKKGYHDPIKRRPVIASIDAKDLIVSNAATDLDGAGRVTHSIKMRPSLLKRMQLVGAYRNIDLGAPPMGQLKNAVDQKIDQIQGIAPPTFVDPGDEPRELYECYCEIEIPGFEHELDGELTGLPLPYKVVVDKESRKVLEIRRNWHEDDEFCLPRNRIIAYVFVPGLGFYGIGLLNILGNATKAVTAAWRLMIDAGMFANFPGFLYVKSLAKQMTNQFRIPPGGGQAIDTVGGDIRASVMALPYKDPSAVFIQLIDNIATQAQRVGGTAELQVGEGKQDAPVGTTLALIEQATKLMSAVHKRMHQAQGQEFDMLRSLLMEDPEALWRHNRKSKVLKMLTQQAGQQALVDAQNQAHEKHKQIFLAALNDLLLTPAADPNTSSMTERYMKVVAMRQMAATNQDLDLNAIDARALQVMGIDDPQTYFKPKPPPGTPVPPPPEQVMAEATKIAAQAKMLDTQIKGQSMNQQLQVKMADIQGRQRVAELGVAKEIYIHQGTSQQKMQSDGVAILTKRAEQEHDLQKTQMGHQAQFALEGMKQGFQHRQSATDRQHSMMTKGVELQHKAQTRGVELAHDAHQAQLDRDHEGMTRGLEMLHNANAAGVQQRAEQQTRGVELAHEAAQANQERAHVAQQSAFDRAHEAQQGILAREHEKTEAALERTHKEKVAKEKPKPVTPKPKKD